MDSKDKIVVSVIKLFPAFGQYATKSSVLLCKQFFFLSCRCHTYHRISNTKRPFGQGI